METARNDRTEAQRTGTETIDTNFETTGAFNMWVQEQPETREVTTNSGGAEQWVVLEEAVLAKDLMDLAHSGSGLEATALARNAIGVIAEYVSYAERKGQPPPVPSPPSALPDAASTGQPPTVPVTSLPMAPRDRNRP